MTLAQLGDMGFSTYIGDGVYVAYDGMHVWLCTSNGLSVTNEVALDPHVLDSFLKWKARYIDQSQFNAPTEKGGESNV